MSCTLSQGTTTRMRHSDRREFPGGGEGEGAVAAGEENEEDEEEEMHDVNLSLTNNWRVLVRSFFLSLFLVGMKMLSRVCVQSLFYFPRDPASLSSTSSCANCSVSFASPISSTDLTDSPQTYRSVARRKTDLMPTLPSPRDGMHFGSRSSLTSASHTPRSPGICQSSCEQSLDFIIIRVSLSFLRCVLLLSSELFSRCCC